MNLQQLRQALADAKAKGAAIMDEATAAGRDLTAAEDADLQAVEAEIKDLEAKVAAAEAQAERRRALEVTGAPRNPAGANSVSDSDPAKTFGFKGLGEFAHAVRAAGGASGGVRDQRLRAAPTDFHEGGGATGEGYLVPPEYRDRIFEVMVGGDPFYMQTDIEPTQAREVHGLADETTPWGSSGVKAAWRVEGAKMDASKMVTEPRRTTLHDIYSFVLATEELREDAPRLDSRLTEKAAGALNWKIDEAVHFGDGVGKPLGWFGSGAAITIAKENGQAAGSVLADNLLKMYSRLLVAPGDRPRWMINRALVPELAKVTIGDKPAWQPPGMLADAPNGSILGLPIDWNEQAKAVGAKGDISLLSPKGYYAARREAGPKFASSMHLFFDYNIEAFRWTMRFGGQPHLSKPVAPANGDATRSHFLTLQART